MPLYKVTVLEVHHQPYLIFAENEEEAKRDAALEGQVLGGEFSYSHTLDEVLIEDVTGNEEYEKIMASLFE